MLEVRREYRQGPKHPITARAHSHNSSPCVGLTYKQVECIVIFSVVDEGTLGKFYFNVVLTNEQF